MQIDVEYAQAFERAYIASGDRLPLIKLAPGQQEQRINVETSHRAGLIRRAMEATLLADSPLYERLPIPVRYRASGAIEAWRQLREDAGKSGEFFSQRLASEPLGDLMHNFPQYLRTWARGNLSCIGDEDDMGHAQRSVIMQAFSASHGALYEPTPALHRLLDDAYIADIAPVQLVHRGKSKTLSNKQRRWLKRRQAIEPIIGHVKHEHGMRRCWLKGKTGDAVHAVLCTAGYNLRWLLRAIARLGLKAFYVLAALLAADMVTTDQSRGPRKILTRWGPGLASNTPSLGELNFSGPTI